MVFRRYVCRLNANPLYLTFSFFFKCVYVLHSVPESFLCGTVSSILKRGKSPTGCSYYRPITVSCNISKIFEHILLRLITKNINQGENQFRFRHWMCCQHAHETLSSLLADNSSKGNGLYICALDILKAFNSVVHSPLFFSLYNSGVIIYIYKNKLYVCVCVSSDVTFVCRLTS